MVLTKRSPLHPLLTLFRKPALVVYSGDQVEMGKSEKVYQRQLGAILFSRIASDTGLRRCRGVWLRSESLEFLCGVCRIGVNFAVKRLLTVLSHPAGKTKECR